MHLMCHVAAVAAVGSKTLRVSSQTWRELINNFHVLYDSKPNLLALGLSEGWTGT